MDIGNFEPSVSQPGPANLACTTDNLNRCECFATCCRTLKYSHPPQKACFEDRNVHFASVPGRLWHATTWRIGAAFDRINRGEAGTSRLARRAQALGRPPASASAFEISTLNLFPQKRDLSVSERSPKPRRCGAPTRTGLEVLNPRAAGEARRSRSQMARECPLQRRSLTGTRRRRGPTPESAKLEVTAGR
jgi:hypothetical protein